MENKECCGTCIYSVRDKKFREDFICTNDKSERIADWVEFEDSCCMYKARPRRRKEKNDE